jgi:ankyrin repeat protein
MHQRVSQIWGDVNVKSSLGTTPRHKALEGGHQEVVETLMEAGADVNTPLLYRRPPLHFAAAMGQKHVALYLLRSGASTGIRDVFGSTRLRCCCPVQSQFYR